MSDPVYMIYPAIGIARVGDAPDSFYIGPETCGGLPLMPDGRPFGPDDFRDAEGRLRRQAARFTIYRQDGAGGAQEVTLGTAGIARIEWTVHVANKKSSWYTFITSQGETGYASNHPLRNADKVGAAERQALIIDPGPRRIDGRVSGPVPFSRDSIPPGYPGSFPPPTIKPYAIETLGELRTDADGRLLVLGGLGRSGSEIEPPAIAEYANNDGWWDDTSDGPVSARITLATGETIQAGPAWVITGPPGYAPQIPNLVTLHDTIFDAAVRHMGARPDIYEDGLWHGGADGYLPSFETDIRPIFERAAGYCWVAAIPPKPHDFDYGRLGDPSPALNGFRRYYLDVIRAPSNQNEIINAASGATMMPYLAGDDAISPATIATAKYLRLTDTQYFFLQQWADGHFRPGAAPAPGPGPALTRGVLENCVGGAFSPGIEMTWISRNPAIYRAPFRIKPRDPVPTPLSLGFDPAAGMEPGDISRYMAVPWQADFNECSSQPIEGRILWWWPAQRPEYVYLPPPAKGALPGPELGPQVAWLGTDWNQQAGDYIQFADDLEMVLKWHQLGFIYNIGTAERPHFVQVARTLPGRQSPAAGS